MSLVQRLHSYNALRPLQSVSNAISNANPDLLVPCDDLAAKHLHELHKECLLKGNPSRSTLIESSVGAPEYFDLIDARAPFLKLAQAEAIRVPETCVLTSPAELQKHVTQMKFPLVLKADGTSSGEGIAIVSTLKEAENAFHALQEPPSLLRTIKWLFLNNDLRSVRPTLLRRRSIVNVQQFVSGREATSLVACWKGEVLAGLHFEVLCEQEAAGPASVLRLIDNCEMSTAAEKMARRLQLSGLHGFDFMLERDTGKAFLIEMNPRATQVGHLALGPGRDLPAALYASVTETALRSSAKRTENDVIVLFPEAWLRNPTSPFLISGYHDVPWEEPDLVRYCLRGRHKFNKWLSRQKFLRALWGPSLPRL